MSHGTKDHNTVGYTLPSIQISEEESEEKEKRTRNSCLFAFHHLLCPPSVSFSSNEKNCLPIPSQNINITALLLSRSSYPIQATKSHDAGCFGLRSWLHRRRWKPCKSVELDLNRASIVTCMEFDHQGILLAVADSRGTIRIFDFDEVNIEYVMARKRCNDKTVLVNSIDVSSIEIANYGKSRRSFVQKKSISPFISISSREARASCIKWDPHNEDQLAVSFFNDADVRLYDLSSSSANGPFFIRLFRKRMEQGLGHKTIHFFMGHGCLKKTSLLTGGTNGILTHWEVPNEAPLKRRGQFICSLNVWKTQSSMQGISEICELSSAAKKEDSGLIFVAGDMGTIAVLDINKCSRKAFSACSEPQVLMLFHLTTFRGLRGCNLPSSKWMGIQRAFIIASQNVNKFDTYSRNTTKDAKHEIRAKKQVNLGIIIKCGWVMYLEISFTLKINWGVVSSKIKLLHRGADISFENTEGEEVEMSDTPVSLPEIPTPAACLHGSSFPLVCVANVKPLRQVLPHKDKSLIDSTHQRTIPFANQRNSILIMGMEGNLAGEEIGTIVLPNGPAHQLAIHPGNQWIVVSTQSNIMMYHLHC